MPYVIHTGVSTAPSATSSTGNTIYYDYQPSRYLHQNTHPIGSKVKVLSAGLGWNGTEGVVVDPNVDGYDLVHIKATKVPDGNYGHVGTIFRFHPRHCRVIPTFLSWARKHK